MADRQASQATLNAAYVSVGKSALWFLAGAITVSVVFIALAKNNAVRPDVMSVFLKLMDFTPFRAEPAQGPPWGIAISLDEQGGSLFANLTRKNFLARLAILVDGSVLSTPRIFSEIGRHSNLTGDFSDEEADNLVSRIRAGTSLEFRMLANGADDKAAIEDAIKLINSDAPEVNKALEEARVKGEPPPASAAQGVGGEPNVYDLVLPGGWTSRVTYAWVRLGTKERRVLQLEDAAKGDLNQSEPWKTAAEFRGKATTLPDPAAGPGQNLLEGALFYSRELKDRNVPAEESAKKQVEYFVRTRNLEIELATGKKTPKIDSQHLMSISKISLNFRLRFWAKEEFAVYVILGILALIAGLLALVRRRIRLPWAFVVGQFTAVLAGVLSTLKG